MKKYKYYELEKFIDYLSLLNKNDLSDFKEFIKYADQYDRPIRNIISHSYYDDSPKKNGSKSKKELIGTLPYVLLDKTYFPTNDIMVKFANKNLGIKIPNPKKKSRNEIMGVIIAEISKKDSKKIGKFSNALNTILGKENKIKSQDFFNEWTKAIRES